MRIEREKAIVELMIRFYCRRKLHALELPAEYRALLDYARARLTHCRYGENKTTCKRCPVHCYGREKRTLIRNVMRWSGPRMLFYHPISFFRHVIGK